MAKLPHTTTTISTTTPKHTVTKAEWNGSSLINTTFHESYHPLDEIDAFLNQLSNAYPNTTRLISLGHSAEGREMTALSISTGPYKFQDDGRKKKKPKKHRKSPGAKDGMKMGFVIVGAQHAREVRGSPLDLAAYGANIPRITVDCDCNFDLSCPRLARKQFRAIFDILSARSFCKSRIPSLLRSIHDFLQNFYIIPVPNPDGYVYTWETDRYWYKNRQILGPYTDCVGLDMNRSVSTPAPRRRHFHHYLS